MVRAYDTVRELLGSWPFPVFTIAAMLSTVLLLSALLFIPASETALGAFAEDFRVWCFGWDPSTGTFEWSYVVVFIIQPLGLALFTAVLWSDALRSVWLRPLRTLPVAGSGVALAVSGIVVLAAVQPDVPERDGTFPAVSLRTMAPAPEVDLIAHDGERVNVADLRGEVVVLTAVYAGCGFTCPTILAQGRRAMEALTDEEREDVTMIAVTLDPKRDDTARLSALAEAHGLDPATWRLLTGEPEVVERTLDRMGIARIRDEESGEIDHANLYLVIDRQGRVAYRFTLGDLQEQWLIEAIQLLVAEPAEVRASL